MREVDTWKDLLSYLQTLTPEQLELPIQGVLTQFDHDQVFEACPAVCIGTVDDLGFEKIRSVRDNRRHGEEIVLFMDHNPHALDGAIAYEWTRGLLEPSAPIYPRGHTPDADWTRTKQLKNN